MVWVTGEVITAAKLNAMIDQAYPTLQVLAAMDVLTNIFKLDISNNYKLGGGYTKNTYDTGIQQSLCVFANTISYNGIIKLLRATFTNGGFEDSLVTDLGTWTRTVSTGTMTFPSTYYHTGAYSLLQTAGNGQTEEITSPVFTAPIGTGMILVRSICSAPDSNLYSELYLSDGVNTTTIRMARGGGNINYTGVSIGVDGRTWYEYLMDVPSGWNNTNLTIRIRLWNAGIPAGASAYIDGIKVFTSAAYSATGSLTTPLQNATVNGLPEEATFTRVATPPAGTTLKYDVLNSADVPIAGFTDLEDAIKLIETIGVTQFKIQAKFTSDGTDTPQLDLLVASYITDNTLLTGNGLSLAISSDAAVLSFFKHLKTLVSNGDSTHATPVQAEIYGSADAYAAPLNSTKFTIAPDDPRIILKRDALDTITASSASQTVWNMTVAGGLPALPNHGTILATLIGVASVLVVEKSILGDFSDTVVLTENTDYVVDYSTRTATKIILTSGTGIVNAQSKIRISWIADVLKVGATNNTALKIKLYLNRTATSEASPSIQPLPLGTAKYAELQYCI